MEIHTEHKAVFSWWTKPWLLWNYTTMKFHLCSRVIAIEFAKKIFSQVEIYTDKQGKNILGALWYECNEELESLDLDKWFRAWGKLLTYSLQREPFIHIDSDCFLRKQLPKEILDAQIFAQNEENDDWFESAYQWQIDYIKKNNFILPKWLLQSNVKKASCLWIVWWKDYDFLSKYAKESLEIIQKNNWIWMTDVWLYNVIFEQWLFDVQAWRKNKQIKYLSYPWIDKEYLTELGYQHLRGAKKDKKTEQMVVEFCSVEYPQFYSLLNTLC